MASGGPTYGPGTSTPPPGYYTNIPTTVPQPPRPSTNVNLQVDPNVLSQLVRIALALETIVEKMGHGFD